MKKLRENIDRFFDRLDENWRAMPVRKQHQYTLYLFVGYLLMTVGVVAKVWYDTSQSKNDMHIGDFILLVLKSKLYNLKTVLEPAYTMHKR